MSLVMYLKENNIKLHNLKERKVLNNIQDLYKNQLLSLNTLTNRFDKVKSNFFLNINTKIQYLNLNLYNNFANYLNNKSNYINELSYLYWQVKIKFYGY